MLSLFRTVGPLTEKLLSALIEEGVCVSKEEWDLDEEETTPLDTKQQVS